MAAGVVIVKAHSRSRPVAEEGEGDQGGYTDKDGGMRGDEGGGHCGHWRAFDLFLRDGE